MKKILVVLIPFLLLVKIGWAEKVGEMIVTTNEKDVRIIKGGNKNDYLFSEKNKAALFWGGGGDDRLLGSWGNDWLWGGKGNDILRGSFGNDTYYYSRGDGKDTIEDKYNRTWHFYSKLDDYVQQEEQDGFWYDKMGEDITDLIESGLAGRKGIKYIEDREYNMDPINEVRNAGIDKITFGESIKPKDLMLKLEENGDLVIGIKDGENSFPELNDRLTIKRFVNEKQKIEFLQFANKFKLNTKKLLNMVGVIVGGEVIDLGEFIKQGEKTKWKRL